MLKVHLHYYFMFYFTVHFISLYWNHSNNYDSTKKRETMSVIMITQTIPSSASNAYFQILLKKYTRL